MSSAEASYLKDVLGVSSWLVPVGESRVNVAAVVFEELTDAGRDLLLKMFSAIQIKDIEIFFLPKDAEKLKAFTGDFLFPFGEVPVEFSDESRWVSGSVALSDILNSSSREQSEKKKLAWTSLQDLKARL